MDNSAFRRVLIGDKLATSQAIHQRLGKAKALAVFSSDALSSTAYATEAIMLVLAAAGSAALGVSLPNAIGIAALMLLVASSYFQTIHAYPNGGGAYIVAKDNLGIWPGLTAAGSLLIDYVLTVAVSVSAGVAALTSAFPNLAPLRIEIALLIVVFITVMNLRGVRESGTFFAIPTYAFIIGMLVMIVYGLFRVATGAVPDAVPIAGEPLHEAEQIAHTLTLFLILRAFAGGCTALTGIEAISNGIPAFKSPESKNAGQTLIAMVVVLCTMFIGITVLANHFPIEVSAHEGHATVLSQIARQIFGDNTLCSTTSSSRRSSFCRWPPTPPTPTSPGWLRSSPRTVTCRVSSPTWATGWSSVTVSWCWRSWRPFSSSSSTRASITCCRSTPSASSSASRCRSPAWSSTGSKSATIPTSSPA